MLDNMRCGRHADLVPPGVCAAHQKDTQRVRLGADVFVHQMIAGHTELHLGDTLSSHGPQLSG